LKFTMWGRPLIGYMTVGSRTRLISTPRPLMTVGLGFGMPRCLPITICSRIFIYSVNLVFKPWPAKILICFRSTFYWEPLSLLLERSLCHDRLQSASWPFESSWLFILTSHSPFMTWINGSMIFEVTSAANFLPMQRIRINSCASQG